MSLHNKIMNIPCEVDKAKNAINRIEYKNGHRDARHRAAELAISYDELLKVSIDMREYIQSLPTNSEEFDRYWDSVIERCKNEK